MPAFITTPSGGSTNIYGSDPQVWDGMDFMHSIYVGNSGSAQQISGGFGNAESGTGSNGGGSATEPPYRNLVSAASIGSTFGWHSGAIFPSDHDFVGFINCKIVTDITSMRFWIGLTSTTLGNLSADTVNFHNCLLRYSTNASDTTWKACTCAGTAANTQVTDTAITVDGTSYKTFGLVYKYNSYAKFYINGALVATNDTYLPATGQMLRFGAGGVNIAASARNMRVVWARARQRFQQ